ncbi:MAG: putative transposase, partial [Deltaproteobacteria bacterium]
MAQQFFLPIIPSGATEINDHVSVWRAEERWTYFVGTHPIYWHHAKDTRSFLLTVSSLIDSGACRQVDILITFAISKSCLDRSIRLYRAEGAAGFFVKRRRGHRSSGHVLTPQILEECRLLLKEGYSPRQIAEEIDVSYDTLRKAFADGRLVLIESEQQEAATTKSSRDLVDAQAASGMGTACTRLEERTLAAFGVCDGAPVRFEACLDVPKGGVLCALPALMMNGLLEGSEGLLGKVTGYYRGFHVLLLLAFMALSRIKTAEKFRDVTPGEFGKLLGLDRVPEVRCLRKKMDDMSAGDAAELWAAHLSKHWMAAEPSAVGKLYIDGHVRVYHGHQTKLPRRFVSRDKLCLRGTTDYWVNDAVGRPFFFVEKVSDPGLLNVLREDIVPRLLKEIPNQPTEEELKANPHMCRFVMVFDREGYSPEFFRDMWKDHMIACMTYHKHPRENWPEESFVKHDVTMPNAERVTLLLAERGSLVGTGKNSIWLREIRKLTESGHQTSIISTYY